MSEYFWQNIVIKHPAFGSHFARDPVSESKNHILSLNLIVELFKIFVVYQMVLLLDKKGKALAPLLVMCLMFLKTAHSFNHTHLF